MRNLLFLLLVISACTWTDGKKSDCGKCSCNTATSITSHGAKNEIGRCITCGEPF